MADDEYEGYAFSPRGIGNNWLDCFVCGHKALSDGLGDGSCNRDMASFVYSREDGEAVVSMFEAAGCTGVEMNLQRESEGRIQVKVGACLLHLPSLLLLYEWCAQDGRITKFRIEQCLPRPNPVRTEQQLAQLAVDRAKFHTTMERIRATSNE